MYIVHRQAWAAQQTNTPAPTEPRAPTFYCVSLAALQNGDCIHAGSFPFSSPVRAVNGLVQAAQQQHSSCMNPIVDV